MIYETNQFWIKLEYNGPVLTQFSSNWPVLTILPFQTNIVWIEPYFLKNKGNATLVVMN